MSKNQKVVERFAREFEIISPEGTERVLTMGKAWGLSLKRPVPAYGKFIRLVRID